MDLVVSSNDVASQFTALVAIERVYGTRMRSCFGQEYRGVGRGTKAHWTKRTDAAS